MTDEIIKNEALEENNAPEAVEPERDIVFEEALEAILFAAGHPVKYASLAKVLKMSMSAVRDRVFDYSLIYNKSGELPRGVMLLTFADSCQLCTKEYYLPEIREALGIRKSGSLSTAAMETLAVVAYNQPVTRLFVDTIRKVDSSYAMNSLIDRGLIECVGRLDVPGRPMQYGVTSDFLRCFGLSNIDELPAASEEFMDMFERGKERVEAEFGDDSSQISFDETNPEDMPGDSLITDDTNTNSEEIPSTDDDSDDDSSVEDDIVDID